MDVAFITVAGLLIVGAVAWHAVDVFAARRLAARKRVLVALRDGSAVTGLLWTRKGRALVLKSAQLLEPGNDHPVPMDGDLILDREQVVYVQVAG